MQKTESRFFPLLFAIAFFGACFVLMARFG